MTKWRCLHESIVRSRRVLTPERAGCRFRVPESKTTRVFCFLLAQKWPSHGGPGLLSGSQSLSRGGAASVSEGNR
jgi:hypothetical protein